MEEIKEVDIEEIHNFIKACNEFVNGRFILADIKISKILRAIADSKDIYNLLAECLIGFDLEKEFVKSRVKNTTDGNKVFRLPSEVHKLIPLVFCLLVEFDSKKLDFNYFLKTQFPYATSQNDEYADFSKSVIIPFRNAVANLFGVNATEMQNGDVPTNLYEKQVEIIASPKGNAVVTTEVGFNIEPPSKDDNQKEVQNPPTESQDDEDDEDCDDNSVEDDPISKDDLIEAMSSAASYILSISSSIKNTYRRDNLQLILKGLIEACKIKNLTIISALVYALNEAGQSEKFLRKNIAEINELCFMCFN